ncbi:MAG TPA: septum formation initiator family protein [Anaerolineae bacterium]
MKKKRQNPKAPVAQFVAIIALSISIFLIVDLGRRAAANYRVQREAERLAHEVELVKRQQAELLAHRTYIASDLYVEEITRKELKWAKPGETVVVVLPTPESAIPLNQTTKGATRATAVQTPAQAWRHLFFGQRSPAIAPATTP